MAARNHSKRGFTLIELVIVIAVIAILAALLIPTILGQAERARLARGMAEINEIGKGFARLRSDVASGTGVTSACYTLTNLTLANVPGSCLPSGLATLPTCSAIGTVPGAPCWGGPYMAGDIVKLMNDPWQKNYYIQWYSTNQSIRVSSNGPNTTNDSSLGSVPYDGTGITNDDLSKVF